MEEKKISHKALGPLSQLVVRKVALFLDYSDFIKLSTTSKQLYESLISNRAYLSHYAEQVLGIIQNRQVQITYIKDQLVYLTLQQFENFTFKHKQLLFKEEASIDLLKGVLRKVSEKKEINDGMKLLKEFAHKKRQDLEGHGHSLLLGYQALGELRNYWDIRYVFTTIGRFFFNASSVALNSGLPALSAVWVNFDVLQFCEDYLPIKPTYDFDELNDLNIQLLYQTVMDTKIEDAKEIEAKFEILSTTLKNDQFNKLMKAFQTKAVERGTSLEAEFTLFRRKLVQWKLYTDGFGISKDRRQVEVAPIQLHAMLGFLVVQALHFRQFLNIDHPRSFLLMASNSHPKIVEEQSFLKQLTNVWDLEEIIRLSQYKVLPPVSEIEKRKNVKIVHFKQSYYEERKQDEARLLFWVCFDSSVQPSSMDNNEHLELVIRLRKRVACRVLTIKALSFLEEFDEVQLRKILVEGWPVSTLDEVRPILKTHLDLLD